MSRVSCRLEALMLLLTLSGAGLLCAGESGATPTPAQPAVQEKDLQPVQRKRLNVFPWSHAPVAHKATIATEANPGMPDMTSGDIIIMSKGPLTRIVQREPADGSSVECLVFTKDVEIEELQSGSVLRAQSVRVQRNLKTGQTELLEAHGDVQVVSPERTGRGETMISETKLGPNGEVLKDIYTLEGNPATGKRATMWLGKDWLEAEKFVSDRRLDKFDVFGGPVGVFTLPKPEQTEVPVAKPGAALPPDMLPALPLNSSGKIHLRADGDMRFDGSSGRLTITRNVTISQESQNPGESGMKMSGDKAIMMLSVAPPGQPASATGAGGNSMMGGTLKTMKCIGRVETKTETQTILSDSSFLDMQHGLMQMDMDNPKDAVQIFMAESPAGGKKLIAPKYFKMNINTGDFEAGGMIHPDNYTGTPPTNRPVLKAH